MGGGILCTLLKIYYLILLARVILSFFPNLPEGLRPIANVVYGATEPLIRLVRPLIPPLRVGNVALDLSVLLIFVLLGFLQTVVCSAGW